MLGLDDKALPKTFNTMQGWVVDDITDGCKTLVCPTKLMNDIYRIWCEAQTGGKNPPAYPRDMYFSNEYKEFSNPALEFNG